MKPWIGVTIAPGALGPGCSAAEGDEHGKGVRGVSWRGINIHAEDVGLSVGGTMDKRSSIAHPVVSAALSPELRERLQAALSLDSVLGLSVERYRAEFERGGRARKDVSYRIEHHRGHLLDVSYLLEDFETGTARYGIRHRVVDLRTGARVTAAEAFRPGTPPELARIVDQRIQRYTGGAAERYAEQHGGPKRFGVADLDHISIDDRGITFMLEFTVLDVFPFGPAEAFFTWDEMGRYIHPDGPLARYASSG